MNIVLGIKGLDGTIKAITVVTEGTFDEILILFKYYRTPERVSALITNGSTRETLGIYISEDELNPNSPLYNEEVTMLPLNIGFPDSDFNETMESYNNNGQTYYFENEQAFYLAANGTGSYDNYIYLYDEETETWTQGRKKENIKDIIIRNIQDPEMMLEPEEIEQQLRWVEEIEDFINRRKNQKPVFVTENGELLKLIYNHPQLMSKYNEFIRLAESLGIRIDGCMCSSLEKADNKIPKATM